MAKVGEGDARWIVEERADGTNADNWHWSEKNATRWSHNKITELLVGLTAEDANGSVRVSEMDEIKGEVIANMRKGKLIFFYEVEVKLKWKGEAKDGSKVNGTISIPNLSEENDADDLDCVVKMTSDDSSEKRKVKDLTRKALSEKIKEHLGKWIHLLKKEYSQDLIKPTKNGGGDQTVQPVVTATPKSAVTTSSKTNTKSTSTSGADQGTKKKSSYVTISMEDEFKCSAVQLFEAICQEDKVRAYTQSDCKIDPKVGGEFSLFSGNVSGVFEEVTPHSKIKQAWRFKHWPAGHFSNVTLTIKEKDGKCKLEMVQSNVPSAEGESTKSGWRSHQWERMKQILGFGTNGPSFNF